MRSLLLSIIVLATAVSVAHSQPPSAAQRRSSKSQKISASELTASIKNNFGASVRVATESSPYYLVGDFNGDGFKDIAVLIYPKDAQADLEAAGVKYIEVDPSSPQNGHELNLKGATFNYCAGVAVMHGTKEGVLQSPGAKHFFYECFTPFRLVPRATTIRNRYRSVKERPPKLKGDAFYLYLERDASSLVYWTGKTYRGYYQ